MVKLIFPAIASLDGYIEDEDGKFDWAVPHEEVHAFINDLERPVGRIGPRRGFSRSSVAWCGEAGRWRSRGSTTWAGRGTPVPEVGRSRAVLTR